MPGIVDGKPGYACSPSVNAHLAPNVLRLSRSMEFGSIMMWFFIADRTSLLLPEDKEYVRDRFAFIFLTLILVAGWTSTAKVKAAVLLNRQQTEEWKGWMQVRAPRGRSGHAFSAPSLSGPTHGVAANSPEQRWRLKGSWGTASDHGWCHANCHAILTATAFYESIMSSMSTFATVGTWF